MKHIFSILSILFCLNAAQAQIFATLDTSYREAANGKFYGVRIVEYNDGTGSTSRTLLGDTTTIFTAYLNAFQSQSGQMATDAREASRFGRDITKLKQQNDEALTATGRDVLDTITAKQAGPLLLSGWVVKDTAGTKNVAFTVNANGQLRYTITGFATRNADLFGGVLRLNNYLSTGQDVDFFKAVSGNWFTIDDKTKIRFPGQNDAANREASAPPKPAGNSGVLLEYYTDSSGKTTFFAGDAVKLKKSGAKYVVNVAGKTFELVEKKK